MNWTSLSVHTVCLNLLYYVARYLATVVRYGQSFAVEKLLMFYWLCRLKCWKISVYCRTQFTISVLTYLWEERKLVGHLLLLVWIDASLYAHQEAIIEFSSQPIIELLQECRQLPLISKSVSKGTLTAVSLLAKIFKNRRGKRKRVQILNLWVVSNLFDIS